jgi:hypothetical protein
MALLALGITPASCSTVLGIHELQPPSDGGPGDTSSGGATDDGSAMASSGSSGSAGSSSGSASSASSGVGADASSAGGGTCHFDTAGSTFDSCVFAP